VASNISREPVDGCTTPAEETRPLASDLATAAQPRLVAVGYIVGVAAAGLAWLLTITTRHVALAGVPLAAFALYFAYRAYDIWTRRLNEERKHAAQLSEAAQAARAALVRATMSEAALGAEKERLALQTARLAATLRTIGDGVITVNEAGSVLLINEAAESLTGLTRAGILDKPVQALFDALGYPPTVTTQALKRVLVEGQPVQLRHDAASPDEERRLVDVTGTPTRDADALVRGAVWVIRDIGDAARLEMERSRATRLESLGTLAGGLAHDFNNILVGVVGNLSLAQSMLCAEDAAIATRLAEAEVACMRARGVTNQLLTFAKGGAPVKTTASMPELVVECSRFALSGSAVAPRFSFDPSVWSAEVDVTQTGQVVHNLVLNAMQAMPRGGVVTIGLENIEVTSAERWRSTGIVSGDYVRLSVEDTGQGISPQHLGHIFDPYYTTKEKGAGLGLAISYSIVRAHGGAITVDSRPGEGCRFDVYLPANRRGAAEVIPSPPPQRRQGRVLLMDDDTEVVEVTRDMLQMLGYDAETTACGTTAIERFREETERGCAFDAVVLDLTVPGGMGGADAVRGIRAIRPEVPVVVTSGYADNAVLAHFRDHGFDGVLPKPFGLADLTRALDEAEANALAMRQQHQRIA
jgi:PAS domain S-box-containing protein